MGNSLLTSQRRADSGVEIIDGNLISSYRFPPKSGSYFGTHFMMAGEKFENMNPERFLFGENSDLNYLPSKPMPFPYSIGKPDEPSNTVRSLVHLRKDTLKLSKASVQDKVEDCDPYWIEFVFDADINCSIEVYLMAKEFLTTECLKYTSRKPELTSEPVTFRKGANQTFRTRLLINPEDFQPSELNYIPGNNEIPLVVQISVNDADFPGQSEATLSGIEKLSDGMFAIKFMKQKIMVDGFCFMTQEIYGIENKSGEFNEEEGDEVDDNIECVICMSNLRDTIMLPCRHLCLCETCGEHMRTSSSRCPICRANFHALLQIKAVRKKKSATGTTSAKLLSGDDELEEVQLIEALNGFNPKEEEEDGDPQFSLVRRRLNSSTRSRRSHGRSRSARGSRTETKNRSSGRACKSASMISNPAAIESSEKEIIPEFPIEALEQEDKHVIVSLPGTPIGSDGSNESAVSITPSSSLLQHSGVSALFNGGKVSRTRALITTPNTACVDERELRNLDSLCARNAENEELFENILFKNSESNEEA